MPRSLAGIPPVYWAIGAVAGVIAFVWMRQRSTSSSSAGAKGAQPGQPSFTQAQEVQDFQIFSSLTSAQQASDLNFLSEIAGMFAGGSSPASSSGSGSGLTNLPPSPTNTGGVPPAVQQDYQAGVAGALGGSGTAPQDAALASAIQSTPQSQRGGLENFFLLNQANQQAGYDYYTSQGLQTTPLGVAPGE